MSYGTRETSVHEGEPIECVAFSRGAQQWLITSADRQVILPSAGTFEPDSIVTGGQDLREEDQKGGVEIELPRTSPIVEPYIPYFPTETTWVRIYRAHRGEESSAICTFFGSIDSVSFRGSIARVQCASLFGRLTRRVPGLAYTVQCNRALYGPGCGVDPESFREQIRIQSIDGSRVTSMAFALRPAGWFTGGWLERSSGERRFIVNHTGDTVELMSPFAALTTSESVYAYAGCDLTRATCIERFANAANFLGFEWIPWRDPHTKRVG